MERMTVGALARRLVRVSRGRGARLLRLRLGVPRRRLVRWGGINRWLGRNALVAVVHRWLGRRTRRLLLVVRIGFRLVRAVGRLTGLRLMLVRVRGRPRPLPVIEEPLPPMEESARATPATVGHLPPDQADDAKEEEEAEGEPTPEVTADHGRNATARDQTCLATR